MNASSAGNVIRSLDMEDDRFSKAQIERFKENPKEYREFVKATEEAVNSKPNTVSHRIPINCMPI
jgi:hypothetical protein